MSLAPAVAALAPLRDMGKGVEPVAISKTEQVAPLLQVTKIG
jgi:hypothetical protein